MASVTTVVVMAAFLFGMVIIGPLVIARGLPKDRDCETEGKLFPPTFHFKVTRNDPQPLEVETAFRERSDLERTDSENVTATANQVARLRRASVRQADLG